MTQPSQSPDLNILDLGMFNSLKRSAEQMKFRATIIEELIEKIEKVYRAYAPKTLNSICNTQILSWNEILKVKGDNVYKVSPRKGARGGPFKVDLKVDVDTLNQDLV